MALIQTHTEQSLHAELNSQSVGSFRSPKSQKSILSLRDIPYVETSFDLAERPSELSSFANAEMNNPQSLAIPEPLVQSDNDKSISLNCLESQLFNVHAEIPEIPEVLGKSQTSTPVKDINSRSPESCSKKTPETISPSTGSPEPTQAELMEEVAKAAGTLAALQDNITTWAPTAHHLVVVNAALHRDTVAFSNSLNTLLNSRIVDPNVFMTHYYHLREAYSSLLCGTDLSRSANANSSLIASSPVNKGENAAWDDRQLLDSFMTLIRTSPGFIASAISEMTQSELTTFCAGGDGSVLNVLFHGVLGSTPKFRPRLLAEIVKGLGGSTTKMLTLVNGLLDQFLGLAMGSLPDSALIKAERFLTRILANKRDYSDFELILNACIPNECRLFLQQVSSATGHHPELDSLACRHLCEFTKQLLTQPHSFGMLEDTYISELQRNYLEHVCQEVKPLVSAHYYSLNTVPLNPGVLWQVDELIAVKASDIISMFNCFLPNRSATATATNNDASFSSSDSGEEWCLESIRTDLVPVMQGLAHSTVTKSDGWQIFKIGLDGLVTDLGSDMGFPTVSETSDNTVEAVCHAISHYDYETVAERIEASRRDAKLSGDFVTLLNLQNAGPEIDMSFVKIINLQINLAKYRFKMLRQTLDQAAQNQRLERERLANLISIMDSSRVHMWFETEARISSPYYKAREFLGMLYPRAKSDDDDAFVFQAPVSSDNGSVSSSRSRRLSILSTHSTPEPPFCPKDIFTQPKLTDKEVDVVLAYMRHNGVYNAIPGEERFHRALVEVANLASKLVDRDHLASYVTFKRDKHYQNQHAQQQAAAQKPSKRHSHHRRSSLGLFDFFDTQTQQSLNLHTTTSTQFLGLASSNESLRRMGSLNGSVNSLVSSNTKPTPHSVTIHSDYRTKTVLAIGPPRWPSLQLVQSLILSELGRDFMLCGTETDKFMQQTGRMLLEGDGSRYQPLLDEISLAVSPEAKFRLFGSLLKYTQCVVQKRMTTKVSPSDVIHELTRFFGRETGSLYRDLQVVASLVSPNILMASDEFHEICEAANNVLGLVVVKAVDYATRFLRYYMETTSSQTPRMAMMGIADAVVIWAFCAKQGNREAQEKLSELYSNFKHVNVELKPLTRPSTVVDGLNSQAIREAVALHWLDLAHRI